MFAAISWYFVSISSTKSTQFGALWLPKEFLIKAMKVDQAESSISVTFLVKFGSLMN